MKRMKNTLTIEYYTKLLTTSFWLILSLMLATCNEFVSMTMLLVLYVRVGLISLIFAGIELCM